MSYPSIHTQLEQQGVTLENANDEQLHQAFIGAFKQDLPLGFAHVEELVQKLQQRQNEGHNRAMVSLDPNSPEGRQFARLLGADMARQVLEREFNVAFGFYNCCGGVGATDKESLQLSLREQIEFQDPNFVNC